ncbi:MAG: GAF domain-containing sensor histidine kinase [Bacteroidetes bacterium]|nr:GAF domain-containing sensor histidine kinase [Bacteroidota bacterium]
MQNTKHYKDISKLVLAVQELSLARNLEGIMAIVRHVARSITGADGATFVLRDHNMCYYADEDAISPLWKGQRFPLENCISGWTMLNKESAMIEDIYADSRIPHEAYRPTFVKSLLMVPIRTIDPIGAIGNYWAQKHKPTDDEVTLLKALADITAVSLENVKIFHLLEKKLEEREEMLLHVSEQNKKLEEFCYIISHNLRAPLSNIALLGSMIQGHESIEKKLQYMDKLKPITDFLNNTFDELVQVTQVRTSNDLEIDNLNLETETNHVLHLLEPEIRSARAEIKTDFPERKSLCYPRKYLQSIIQNLVSNSIRFRSPDRYPYIHIRWFEENEWMKLTIKDNGLGIDLKQHGEKLFKLHKTFHQHTDSKGFGLFITKSQVEAMGGKIMAQSSPNEGSTFTVYLQKQDYAGRSE